MNLNAAECSRSIQEGKWVQIDYDSNTSQKRTFFWIAILDIEAATRKLTVKMFNPEISWDTKDGTLFFDKILTAHVIDSTTFPLQQKLIEKIQNNYSEFDFLEYSGINDRVLSYYKECTLHDKETSIRNTTLLSGVDSDTQFEQLQLSQEKFQSLVKKLKAELRLSQLSQHPQFIRLAMNVLAIQRKNNLYPIVYHDLLLDIEAHALIASTDFSFNMNILDDQEVVRFSLLHYIDCSAAEFMENFEVNREELTQQIIANCKPKEIIDERPYLFECERHIPVNLDQEYRKIQKMYETQKLSAPLKAFFGMPEKTKRRKKFPILVLGRQVNLHQFRTIYNAMNQDVVYVQGPPGTGKTATIINVIASCFYNDQTALIVSNNNEAIQTVLTKLTRMSWQGRPIPFPLLRLGSNPHIHRALEQMRMLSDAICQAKFTQEEKEELTLCQMHISESLQGLSELLENIEAKLELEEQCESLQGILQQMGKSEEDQSSVWLAATAVEAQLQKCQKQLEDLGDIQEEQIKAVFDQEEVSHYLYLKSRQTLQHLKSKKNQDLDAILHMQNSEQRLREFRKYIQNKEGMNSLLSCFPFLLSTNMSCNKLAEPGEVFDLMIMDEAGQCSNALALLPIARAKRALFVGDPSQLQPVISLSRTKNARLVMDYDIPDAYDYCHNSILSTMLKVDSLSKFILLKNHYRCADSIIAFSNHKYYGDELVMNGPTTQDKALKLVDVKSTGYNSKNVALEEVQQIIQEVKQASSKEVAVITPFRRQANTISQALQEEGLDYVKVGTIHTFQGDEKDTVILSCAISEATTQASFDWVKNNQELINVATTRAKNKFVMVADKSRIRQLSAEPNDLRELMNYVEKQGESIVSSKQSDLFLSKVKNFKYFNTLAEEEFLQTLLHIKSVFGQISVKSKVKVSDALTLSYDDLELFTYGNQAHFDFAIYDLSNRVIMAIEICGTEHYNDKKVQQRDEKKRKICQEHHLKLITIRNDYVRRYSFIKETILSALTEI